MKKLGMTVMTLVLAAGILTACGAKEQTVTYRSATEQNGLTMVDTMTLDATGDKVEKLTEVLELDMTNLDAETQALLVETYAGLVEQCQEMEGVECTGEVDGTIYKLNFVVDTTTDAVPALVEIGMLNIEGDADGKISLKATGESLEAGGYVLVE